MINAMDNAAESLCMAGRLGVAVGAQGREGEVGEPGAVARGVVQRVVDGRGRVLGQRRHGAAALADREGPGAAGGLVEPGAVAEVDVADEPEALAEQLIENGCEKQLELLSTATMIAEG